MTNYPQLLQQVQEYVLTFYKTHTDDTLIYHNLQHTESVVAAATQISNHYQLNDHDFAVVMCACWFHDLGYFDDAAHHEEKGAAIATDFLTAQQVDNDFINAVKGCIMATKMPQSPSGLLEQITCDADLFHLGLDDFFEKDKLMRQEYITRCGVEITKQEWRLKTVKFLEMHHYQTDYCQLLLADNQAKNMQAVKDKIQQKEAKETKKANKEQRNDLPVTASIAKPAEPLSDNAEPAADFKIKKKKNRPEKGIETMFRISSSNHQRLSNMADNKAHIMITVNSIILSAIISLLLRRLAEYEYLVIPTFIILLVSVLAMTFSILSTRPSIPPGVFTREDVDNKNVNLLFFGNFYKMDLADYTYGMEKMMESDEFLYGSLIKDVYFQGVVLGRKYRLLRVAYNIFMFGLIIAVLAFIVAAAFFSPDLPAHTAPRA